MSAPARAVCSPTRAASSVTVRAVRAPSAALVVFSICSFVLRLAITVLLPKDCPSEPDRPGSDALPRETPKWALDQSAVHGLSVVIWLGLGPSRHLRGSDKWS